jgi:hypothetical protein
LVLCIPAGRRLARQLALCVPAGRRPARWSALCVPAGHRPASRSAPCGSAGHGGRASGRVAGFRCPCAYSLTDLKRPGRRPTRITPLAYRYFFLMKTTFFLSRCNEYEKILYICTRVKNMTTKNNFFSQTQVLFR